MSIAVGDKLVAAGVPIFQGYGGSEFGNPTQAWDEMPTSELRQHHDWAWLKFSPVAKVEMDPQGDGTYELVVHVSVCPAKELDVS